MNDNLAEKASYVRCQAGDVDVALSHWRDGGNAVELAPNSEMCDGNGTESVNVPDGDHEDDLGHDRLFWVCLEHFEFFYHSFIYRRENGKCDCLVCTGKAPSRSVRVHEKAAAK